MATSPDAPQTTQLPLFYNDLVPLSRETHAKWRVRPATSRAFVAAQHAVPITVEEFALVQRYMPIVFGVSDEAAPLALMGLNEGVNVLFDADGEPHDPEMYVPSYIRRYPYLLAKLTAEDKDLSLCFDPTSDTIGDFADGEPLFVGSEPSELTRTIMTFVDQFEQAGTKTTLFLEEINKLELLIDGEVAIQIAGREEPVVYRGFRIVDEHKLARLDAETHHRLARTGALSLIYAHLFSIALIRTLAGKQFANMPADAAPQPAFAGA